MSTSSQPPRSETPSTGRKSFNSFVSGLPQVHQDMVNWWLTHGTTSLSMKTYRTPSSSLTSKDSSGRVRGLRPSFALFDEIDGFYCPRLLETLGSIISQYSSLMAFTRTALSSRSSTLSTIIMPSSQKLIVTLGLESLFDCATNSLSRCRTNAIRRDTSIRSKLITTVI